MNAMYAEVAMNSAVILLCVRARPNNIINTSEKNEFTSSETLTDFHVYQLRRVSNLVVYIARRRSARNIL